MTRFITVWVLLLAIVSLQVPSRDLVALRQLVSASDPLAAQDLQFDARFADTAIAALEKRDAQALAALAAMPAAQHMINHARHFDNDVPRQSTRALVEHLLSPSTNPAAHLDAAKRSLAFFTGPLLDDPHWLNDVLRYLPLDFRFRGSVFLTFGYDIGVALAPNASLNAAHPHFDGHPRELLYYAIHELHHVGFMTYRPPPRVADLKTCRDLLRLVDYSTALEGMAVHVARSRREAEHAAADDADYVALEDPSRMAKLEAQYFKDYEYLRRRGNEAADSDALAVVERMSSGDRLWYRVGALMALRIERVLGRQALVRLITPGTPGLVETYESLRNVP